MFDNISRFNIIRVYFQYLIASKPMVDPTERITFIINTLVYL